MNFGDQDLLLVTGATGFVGSHVAERARQRNIRTRTIMRGSGNGQLLNEWGVETISGDMTNPDCLKAAVDGVTAIVHCAAKVGDWGPIDDYRQVNVQGLKGLLNAAEATGRLKRFVHVSSLGVYEARDHHGTNESEQPSTKGIDGYTLSKVEAEQLVLEHVRTKSLPATILRPGFIYGPRDRTVIPRLLEKLKSKQFAFLGSGEQLMNNTFVGNLVDAIFLALERDDTVGQIFNVRDGMLVSKRDFVDALTAHAGYTMPTKCVPLPVARVLARSMESIWKLLGKKEAPLLSNARIKFLGLNLDFSIDKARKELGYEPHFSFDEGMKETVDWFREKQML